MEKQELRKLLNAAVGNQRSYVCLTSLSASKLNYIEIYVGNDFCLFVVLYDRSAALFQSKGLLVKGLMLKI